VERLNKNKGLFKFQYLPDYAKFLLDHKLEEFTTVGIRFCRELDLPMMRPLAKIPENELVELSIQANKDTLTALSNNNIESLIAKNIETFVNNRMVDGQGNKLIDQTDVVAEDFILGFYIRRKLFSFFLHSYSKNAVLHTLIAGEVDYYSTQEHLITVKAYVEIVIIGQVKCFTLAGVTNTTHK
jgi:hypothetical protein